MMMTEQIPDLSHLLTQKTIITKLTPQRNSPPPKTTQKKRHIRPKLNQFGSRIFAKYFPKRKNVAAAFCGIVLLAAFFAVCLRAFSGQTISPQVADTMRTIAASPTIRKGTSVMPVVGSTTITWGLGIGAYLFIVAAALRLAGGLIMYTTPEMQKKPAQTAYPAQYQMPPPPPPLQTYT